MRISSAAVLKPCCVCAECVLNFYMMGIEAARSNSSILIFFLSNKLFLEPSGNSVLLSRSCTQIQVVFLFFFVVLKTSVFSRRNPVNMSSHLCVR